LRTSARAAKTSSSLRRATAHGTSTGAIQRTRRLPCYARGMSSPLEGRWILGGSWLLSASLALLAGCSGGPAPLVPALGSSELPADLVYEREVAGNQDLYILPASGGPEYRLTTHPPPTGFLAGVPTDAPSCSPRIATAIGSSTRWPRAAGPPGA
jgi:hypothetical protein